MVLDNFSRFYTCLNGKTVVHKTMSYLIFKKLKFEFRKQDNRSNQKILICKFWFILFFVHGFIINWLYRIEKEFLFYSSLVFPWNALIGSLEYFFNMIHQISWKPKNKNSWRNNSKINGRILGCSSDTFFGKTPYDWTC